MVGMKKNFLISKIPGLMNLLLFCCSANRLELGLTLTPTAAFEGLGVVVKKKASCPPWDTPLGLG